MTSRATEAVRDLVDRHPTITVHALTSPLPAGLSLVTDGLGTHTAKRCTCLPIGLPALVDVSLIRIRHEAGSILLRRLSGS